MNYRSFFLPKFWREFFSVISDLLQEVYTNLNVEMNHANLLFEKYPNLLGVFIDPCQNFANHPKQISTKAKCRISILMALSGTQWASPKKMLLVTFKDVITQISDNADPASSQAESKKHFYKLQTVRMNMLHKYERKKDLFSE